MKPPDTKPLLAFLLILAIGVPVFNSNPKMAEKGSQGEKELVYLEGNSLIGGHPIPLKPQILSVIMECESGGNPSVCNKEYGCRAGMGLYQLIPSTVEYCEEKLNREIDPFNPQDNETCALWLYENEGLKHWEQSKSCWGKVVELEN